MRKYRILTLNQISSHGLHRFPAEHYAVGKAVDHPDAILVRSHDMHAMTIPPSVRAIGRAGAGTNNIPVAEMSKRGVPVFNAPGANANAVKELVLAALLIASRNVVPALALCRRPRCERGGPRKAGRGRQRRNSPASNCRTARSASSVSARSAASSPTPRSSSG